MENIIIYNIGYNNCIEQFFYGNKYIESSMYDALKYCKFYYLKQIFFIFRI